MSDEQKNSYDEVPYHSDPFAQTQPVVAATIATLFGMEPPPVDKCRVLEIGCAAGGNLIPAAMEAPKSTFVGVDLSTREITEGKETVSVLGLKNIDLQAKNVMDIGKDFGEFDYIIAHGVFSWVPPAVADKILEVCSTNLSAKGVAYVSYNTLPGWHMRGMIRDMMCYHTKQFTKPGVKINQARALLKFMAECVPGEKNPYGIYLRNELEFLQKMRDFYIYHEHLEKENHPVYFHEFVERADSKGLQYLGEAAFGAMAQAAHDLPEKVQTTLNNITPNAIQREQYMDFIRNRTFRQTLLCHKELSLDRTLNPQNVAKLYVSSGAKPATTPVNLQTLDPQPFTMGGTHHVPVRQPITKAALLHLSEIWPKALPFSTLLSEAQKRIDSKVQPDSVAVARDTQLLATGLLSLYALGYADLGVREAPTSPPVSDRPVASQLARLQAQRGASVTNRRHRTVGLSEFERRAIEYLDGRHDRQQLAEIIEGLVSSGGLVVKKVGEKELSADEVKKLIKDTVEASLTRFHQSNLLVS